MLTEISGPWRRQPQRYRSPLNPIGVVIDNEADTMIIIDNLKGRPEVYRNHGRIVEWAKVLVSTAREWQYNEGAARQMVLAAAADLDGREEDFIKAAEEALARVYGG
jgi:hypothetical protein